METLISESFSFGTAVYASHARILRLRTTIKMETLPALHPLVKKYGLIITMISAAPAIVESNAPCGPLRRTW
jgi:hypothetical protein